MTHDTTDCGYRNHETMLIAMDINNNNGLQFKKYWIQHARACVNRRSLHTDYDSSARLAGILKCHYEQKKDDCVVLKNKSTVVPQLGKADILGDLLASAVERVDWMEIAKELIEEVIQEQQQCPT